MVYTKNNQKNYNPDTLICIKFTLHHPIIQCEKCTVIIIHTDKLYHYNIVVLCFCIKVQS